MIQNFIQSWDLFANTYLAGWLIAALLAMIGVVVVARDQVFIGMAVAQASTLGVAVSLALGASLGGALGDFFGGSSGGGEAGIHGGTELMAVLFAVAAALLTTRPSRAGRDSHEAMAGWVFLLGASLSILLVTHSPHGEEEVKRLLASSLIGATDLDVWLFTGAAVVTAGALLIAHRRIMLIVMDAETAEALGLRVRAWNSLMAVWLGLALGLSLHVSGLLYVFGCLVLPPLVARNLCRRVMPMFFVAPAVALAAAVAGFIIAHDRDFPPAQTVVALLGLMLPAAWVYRRGVRPI